jgi:hypothetical protein
MVAGGVHGIGPAIAQAICRRKRQGWRRAQPATEFDATRCRVIRTDVSDRRYANHLVDKAAGGSAASIA